MQLTGVHLFARTYECRSQAHNTLEPIPDWGHLSIFCKFEYPQLFMLNPRFITFSNVGVVSDVRKSFFRRCKCRD